jgi:hypothetical protein
VNKNEKAKKMGWMNPPTSFHQIRPRGMSSEAVCISSEAGIVLCKSRAGKPPTPSRARI